MKTKKTATSKSKKQANDIRHRKMEPIKSKELKNQRYDLDEEEASEMDPEVLDENFKGFEESFDGFDEEEEDF